MFLLCVWQVPCSSCVCDKSQVPPVCEVTPSPSLHFSTLLWQSHVPPVCVTSPKFLLCVKSTQVLFYTSLLFSGRCVWQVPMFLLCVWQVPCSSCVCDKSQVPPVCEVTPSPSLHFSTLLWQVCSSILNWQDYDWSPVSIGESWINDVKTSPISVTRSRRQWCNIESSDFEENYCHLQKMYK